ncbi:winged helix-turn-helix transcriptional regulator [Halopenitus persicus]|uniref:Transcriptional regulator, HxlR family n=1 Tax=Halopenitus persicus TaxID=1048396 RepID=A0A1H3FKS1_9EURY|nr:helix-turn-helix domain-containing protein [Halopenitus persicus]QHS16702.1 helix-turn-helix transcriptional regulator [haloarchaeon 3A1-DGR]SDX91606.1 transcriptional regulator, HxlR family [Halopenitus persicus]
MSDPSPPGDPPDSDDGDGNDHDVDSADAVDPDDAVERLEVWCAGEDWCPVTTTATLIGKKWHPVIIHRLLEHGPSGFNELQDAVDGISSKVLSDSLEDLQENRLVEREIISEKPFRVQYSLTDHGRSLEPVIYSMRDWGVQHLAPPN